MSKIMLLRISSVYSYLLNSTTLYWRKFYARDQFLREPPAAEASASNFKLASAETSAS
jgi:hypothetical protein